MALAKRIKKVLLSAIVAAVAVTSAYYLVHRYVSPEHQLLAVGIVTAVSTFVIVLVEEMWM